MTKSTARLRTYIGWLLASAFVIVAACFTVNCLVDPLWYLRCNILTEINYPFNERLSFDRSPESSGSGQPHGRGPSPN